MPPKTKTDKTMILDAAFSLIREEGVENLNARTIAKRLGCSTQPVLYHFKTIEEIKEEAYQKADEFHGAYLMQPGEGGGNPFLSIGLNYIRFGYEEKHLFRFLFQSDHFAGADMPGLVNDERLSPVLGMLSAMTGCDPETAKERFLAVYSAVHGIASLLANNGMEYDKELNERLLQMVFTGVFERKREDA